MTRKPTASKTTVAKSTAKRKPARREVWAESTAVKERISEEIAARFSKSRRTKVRSLVMVSGGVESVCLLANLLKWTKGPIHAHFIVTINIENRHEVEIMATQAAVTYCRETIRDFTFTTSTYEMMLGLGGGLDLTLHMFQAARINTATGGITDAVWTGHYGSTWNQLAEGSAVFAAAHVNKRFKPHWIMPFRGLQKIDIYRSMPMDLAKQTWSCRRPQVKAGKYIPCGTCHSCKSMSKVEAALDKAKAPGA